MARGVCTSPYRIEDEWRWTDVGDNVVLLLLTCWRPLVVTSIVEMRPTFSNTAHSLEFIQFLLLHSLITAAPEFVVRSTLEVFSCLHLPSKRQQHGVVHCERRSVKAVQSELVLFSGWYNAVNYVRILCWYSTHRLQWNNSHIYIRQWWYCRSFFLAFIVNILRTACRSIGDERWASVPSVVVVKKS